ncbi:hypothetical protein [Leifsonia sp. 21MFCrub1.1]|uniref:hypothetical protein n=1 Tax=Leifsonia sp. 21MFCrub1.1 TaxID=1798223 RepID=UPI00089298C4|nr:hypothetical protein [Leifsonia sp. 21MFCrub1.1]SEB09097.1 hypothetical protein SAMN04515680_3196 [Leifsonia sp. 21MFCrub1.1]
MLTNREAASLILIAGVALFTALIARSELKVMVKLLFASRITVLFLLYVLYGAAVVWLASTVHLWQAALLKDTILVMLTVAFPLLWRSVDAETGTVLVRRTLRAVIGIGAALAFYINLASLTLAGELGVQIVIVGLSACVSVFEARGRKVGVTVASALLASIGVAGIVYTTVWLVLQREHLNFEELGLTAAMTVWLPLALLPFLYVAALYAAIELVYVRLPYVGISREVPFRVRLAVFLGLRGSVRYAKGLVGKPLLDVSQNSTFAGARRAMRQFRAELESGQLSGDVEPRPPGI